MQIEFCIQDPSHPETTYLYEAIIRAAEGAASWRGVYAFATRDGVNWLFEEQVINQLLVNGGEVDLLVGLDAITNRRALERLRELEEIHERFRPRVFWNEIAALFHPKISDFSYADGGRTLVVGSGNLTPGGLMNNVEGYAVISADQGEEIDLSAMDEFFQRHADAIRPIDDEALERAEQNVIRRINRGQQDDHLTFAPPRRARRPVRLIPGGEEGRVTVVDRILIAEVPRAGGRWSQVHFNGDVVQLYFRIADFETQRAYLTHVRQDGTRSDVEVRQCVFSQSNRNHRIEFGAATGLQYPAARPLLVLRERQLRVFDYMLLLPNSEGYAEVMDIANALPSIGRGVRRVITDANILENAWAECSLLADDNPEDFLA